MNILNTLGLLVVVWSSFFFWFIVGPLCFIPFTRNLLFRIYQAVGLISLYHSVKASIAQRVRELFVKLRGYLLGSLAQRHADIGYALLKENGKYLKCASDDVLCYQLYDYLARRFLYLQALGNKAVLEVNCGRRRAIEYIAQNLGVRKCTALNSDLRAINQLQKHKFAKNVQYRPLSAQQWSRQCQQNHESYDCIISINAQRPGQSYPAKLKVLKSMLAEKGYISLCEIIPADQVHAFERTLYQEGFRTSKSENITKNVLQAIKLETRNSAAQPFSLQKLMKRMIDLLDDPVANLAVELQEGRCKAMAYIVECTE